MADTHWAAAVSSVTGVITALGVVVAGLWAFFRFRREAPDLTRADVKVSAELLTDDGIDVLRVAIQVHAVGTARLTLRHDDDDFPTVSVYRFTKPMLEQGPPDEFTDPVTARRVLFAQEFVEAGETVDEVHLFPVGRRDADTVAYRVEFLICAEDPSLGGKAFTWQGATFVDVTLKPHPIGHNGE